MGMIEGEGAYRPGVRPTGRKWPRLEGELGGFIFITSADAMRDASNDDECQHDDEDKATRAAAMKFALPAAFAETVAKIASGMPVFLYDVTHRLLHGVYEASPCEEQQNKTPISVNASRFPAHVRVRRRKEFPPQPDSAFRPLVYHYDGPKFRLELSRTEVVRLLELFRDSAEQQDGWMKIGSGGQVSVLRRKNTRNGSNSKQTVNVMTSAAAPTQCSSSKANDMNTSPMYKLSAARFCQKVYIPLDEHPGFNFVGLIIGPKGRHQKMLEGTCGAKIAVRGQGGTFHASPRRDGRPDVSHDDLHVLVQGESEEIVERGVELICKVLRPPDGKTWKPGRQGSVSTLLQELARAAHDYGAGKGLDTDGNENNSMIGLYNKGDRQHMEGNTVEQPCGKEGLGDGSSSCWGTSSNESEDSSFINGDHIEKLNLERRRMMQSPTAQIYANQRQQHSIMYPKNAMNTTSGSEPGRLLSSSPTRMHTPISYSAAASKSVLDNENSNLSNSELETGVNEDQMLETTALSVAESVWPSWPVTSEETERFQRVSEEYPISIELGQNSGHNSPVDLANPTLSWNASQRLQKEHSAIIDAVRKALICPLSGQVMSDPIVCSDGRTYERKAIEGMYKDSSFHPQPVAKNWNLIQLLGALQKLG